jgi:hypothetical protein
VAGPRPTPSEEDSARKIAALVASGDLSKAYRYLGANTPMVNITPAMKQKLQALFPNPTTDIITPDPALDGIFGTGQTPPSKDTIIRAIRSIPKASAPGQSGMRPAFLQALAECPRRSPILIKLINYTISHGIPSEAKPYYYGGKLFGLGKGPQDPTGVRPIVAGEVLCRVTEKAVL